MWRLKPCANVVVPQVQNRRSLEIRESLPSCKRDAALPGYDRMTRALRNISASVEKRLLNLSRQSGEDFQYVLMRFGLERLMYRLSRSVYAKGFVVKGALLLRLWTGEQY